ncbi:hypothetical protein Pcinc_001121 [Petrolisthes cinctipes]|uniref:CIDE-N domain-containing protein n=1 Tax=Petrolisthes cinctipes TaxID=88211 RepID=A0AAE1GLY8_PETCI|nr:hypothetical protein Pcinc_001121 [Petrolisthes cinctipes]
MTHFVVTGPGHKKVGIIAPNFREFLSKCRRKFGYKKNEEKDIVVYLTDDTEVDEEYFEILPAGTHLRVSLPGEVKTPDYIQQLAVFLYQCLEQEPNLHQRVLKCLKEPPTSDRAAALLELLARTASNTVSLTSRDKDPEWFRGLNTKFNTKEGVMRNSCESRMRGYFQHTRQELLADTPHDHPHITNAITFFRHHLHKTRHNSSYFDRSASDSERLCDDKGFFSCEGPYDQHTCPSLHFINPYTSREARIIFSTWNLDHVIEKSRTVLPTLKASLSSKKGRNVNLQYFHQLLFLHKDTTIPSGNLKLVHVACHVKKPHQLKIEPKYIYLFKDSTDNIDGPQTSHTGKRLHQQDIHYYTRSKKRCLSTTTRRCVRSQVKL